MDFVVGIEGMASQDTGSAVSEQEAKLKRNGSGVVKQERSAASEEDEEDCRASKMARAAGGEDLSLAKTMPIHQGTPLLRSNSHSQSQMLSFASPRPEVSFLSKEGGLGDKTAPNMGLSYYQHTASAYTRNAGYGSGNFNGNMHGSMSGIRGPFTPAQWIELEHQALIYKYLAANVPVPTSLLIPIRKALNPTGYSGFSAGCFPSHSYGWGSFHLGFSGSTDPEPGRCRRTDGKKWRCSRDAVPDQKYCERHMNRGRHRSRKPVEGQNGQAASGATNPKVAPMSSSVSSSVAASGSASNTLANAQHHLKGFQSAGATNPSAQAIVHRLQASQGGMSVMPPAIDLKSKDSPFSIPRQVSYDQSSQSEFGFVSSDSLLNPSQRNAYLNCKNYNLFMDFNGQQSQDDHTLRQFMDDWPKDQSNRSSIAWGEELKSDWTQLSMSIPMSSDFSSSSSSPNQEKIALSPLRLSPTPMGLGVGSVVNESSSKQQQSNWVPISWGNSMGGPLAEVLNNTGGSMGTYNNKSASALNLMSERWDGSPQLGSSPTGVLQKATFVSLSNSSSGSSPRAENKKTQEGASLCDDLLGPSHATSSSIPA